MTLFWLIAAAMVVVALVFVVPPLLGRGKGAAQSRKALAILSSFEKRPVV